MKRTLRGCLLAACLSASTITLHESRAGIWHSDEVLYGASMEIDDPYDGSVLQIQATDADGSPVRATAVRLNEWYGLTAAHVLYGRRSGRRMDVFVDPGDNYRESQDAGFPNAVEVADFGIHPDWLESVYRLDLGWIRFAEPIPGPDLVIGQMGLRTQFRVVGFGAPGVAGEDWRRENARGPRRAFDLVVDRRFAGERYGSYFLPLDERDLPYGGMGSPGDSGGPGFNSSGELVSILSAGGNLGQYGSGTSVLSLYPYLDFIEEFTTIRVPEPAGSALIVLAIGLSGLARRR